MAVPKHTNGWAEWSRHVLAELTRLNDSCEQIANENKIQSIRITELKSSINLFAERQKQSDEAIQDHETRVRSLERGFWRIVGAVTFASFIIQVLIKFL